MLNENELKALISLLEDPDKQIYTEVSHRLSSFGSAIISKLEECWEQNFDPIIQKKLENIIHNIQFEETKNELLIWKMSNSFNLLDGLLIINSFQYPSYDSEKVILTLEELKREVWMELHYEMNPREKVKLLNHVLFTKFGLSGNTSEYHHPQNSYISMVLETKKGNPLTLSCIYSIIAQKLDIPIYGVNLPKHFILAYTDHNDADQSDQILFYINAFNKGQRMQKSDVVSFLKQLNLPLAKEYTMPCDNVTIIKRVIRNLMTAYKEYDNPQKVKDLEILFDLINED